MIAFLENIQRGCKKVIIDVSRAHFGIFQQFMHYLKKSVIKLRKRR